MSVPTLAFKGVAVDEGTDSQVVDINEAEGIVTAVVSVTGTKDDVDDVIIPGAYAETLKARNPKVCWHHSWEKPIGRVLHVEELLPGDRRLPTKQRNGLPWPKEAGALIATMQFNLKSQRGREAFEAVVFYSESGECEWSIGYQVPTGKAHRDKQGVRWIKSIDLFELSFVLFGAHNMTGTLALKAAAVVMQAAQAAATKAAGTVVIRRADFEAAIKALNPDDSEQTDPPADTPPTDTPPPAAPADPAPTETPGDGEGADDTDPAVNPELATEGDQGELLSIFDVTEDADGETLPATEDGTGTPPDATPDGPDAEPDSDEQNKPAAKALDAARVTIKARKSWTLDQYLAATLVDAINEPLDAKTFGIELTPLGEIKDTNPGDQSQGARELIRWYERGEGAAKIRWGTKGDFMRCVRIAEKHMTPEQAKGFCSNRHQGALGVRPGQEGGGKKAYENDVDPLDTAASDRMAGENEPEHTGVMVALYPDKDAANQIAVRGGEEPEELHVTLAYLGDMTDDAGGGLTLEDVVPQIIAAAQIAAATNQPLSGTIGGLGAFPDSGDGVPVFAPVDVVGLGKLREDLVTALDAAGLPVKVDHGFTPHCTLGWNLDMSLIRPVEAVPVEFDKMVVVVGDSRTDVTLGTDPDIPSSGAPVAGAPFNAPLPDQQKAAGYDPSIETGPDAGHRPAVQRQHKSFPYLEGTFEERKQEIERALTDALLPDPEEDPDDNRAAPYLSIDGTFPDRVVCTVNNWGGPGPGERQSYEVPYTVTDDGTVMLGEPEKIRLSVVAVDDEGNDMDDDVAIGDMMPLAEMIGTVTSGIKTVSGGLEVKAGRVLSGANAQRLKTAVEHLISVLAAAGIEIGDPTNEKPTSSSNPTIDTETTAPSAREGAVKRLTTADLDKTLAALTAGLED